ncbi:hypothetical protein MUP06_00215 [Patescibacteria group bacterium]|nr:hypothetical protein [Patescibacteria group bacterium]
MKKEAQKIADQIKQLVDQLAAMATAKSSVGKPLAKAKKGASGSLSMLIEEGFFDSPKDLPTIMSRLEEIGHWYPKPTVSMNLLNLTKRRTFNRLKDTKNKNWKYVLRK